MTTDTSPTRVRYGVLGFACSLSMITYLDRACFGVASDSIIKALSLQGISDLTLALAAFNLAYAAFEVPTGYLGDVFGPRKTLVRIVLWWSFFTALTGMAGFEVASGVVLVNLTGLIVIRFLFGIGEAGAYPNITRALHNWFPLTERGFAQGMVWMSGRLMGGLTPLVWLLLVELIGMTWRSAFWLFGLIGVAWCVAFATWFRNRPEEHPSVNDAELAVIQSGTRGATEQAHAKVPWGELLRSWNLWAICLMYFFMSYGWYFYVGYLPNFLQVHYDVSPKSTVGSLYKGAPLIFGAVGCILGGWLTDRYVRRTGDRKWGRRIFGMFGHGVCVPCFLACLVAPNAFMFALCVALAGFFNDLAMGSAWATCQDIGRRHAAIVAGCMNTIGNLGGFVATLLSGKIIGWTLRAYESANGVSVKELAADESRKVELLQVLRAGEMPGYQINFVIFAAAYAIAMLLWLRIDATKPVLTEDAQTEVAT